MYDFKPVLVGMLSYFQYLTSRLRCRGVFMESDVAAATALGWLSHRGEADTRSSQPRSAHSRHSPSPVNTHLSQRFISLCAFGNPWDSKHVIASFDQDRRRLKFDEPDTKIARRDGPTT